MNGHSMNRRPVIVFLLIISTLVYGQQARILKSIGNIAVISSGAERGIKRGDFFTVYRKMGAGWKPLTYVQVTRINPRLSRVEMLPMAPQIPLQPGDRVLSYKYSKSVPALSRMGQPELLFPTFGMGNQSKGLYAGPVVGLFIPLDNMADDYETTLCYGAVLGLKFRSDLDICAKFLFTAYEEDYSLWNVQMLGRRHSNAGFTMDFGYGVLYPQIWQFADISLGFCGGMGYCFQATSFTCFEFGVLYSYYPHFMQDTAQFLTMELRLML
jgi:hypothetical protein